MEVGTAKSVHVSMGLSSRDKKKDYDGRTWDFEMLPAIDMKIKQNYIQRKKIIF